MDGDEYDGKVIATHAEIIKNVRFCPSMTNPIESEFFLRESLFLLLLVA